MFTAINNAELIYLNPTKITEVKAVGFKISLEYTYKKKSSFFKQKGVYCINSFFITKSLDTFLKNHNDFIADENNVIYEKPYILIRLTNNKMYTWHYDSVEAMNDALKTLLDDLRTVGNSLIRVNRKTEEGPHSI